MRQVTACELIFLTAAKTLMLFIIYDPIKVYGAVCTILLLKNKKY